MHPPLRTSRSIAVAAVFAVVLLPACGGGAPAARQGGAAREAPAAESASGDIAPAGAAEPGLLEGTPPGGLREWIGDVTGGLARDVGPLARTSPAKALEKAVALYVTRQEYIERYYEKGQPLYASDELAEAVKEAESRFHELMQVLQRHPPDTVAVDEAVERLRLQYTRVLSEAGSAGARMSPRSGGTAAEHRS